MNRDSLLNAAYHSQKVQEHTEALRQNRRLPLHDPEEGRHLTQAERFDLAEEALGPFWVNDDSGRLRTPEVPITGDVDGEHITVWLRFETSRDADVLYYVANHSGRKTSDRSDRFVRRPMSDSEAYSPLITDLEETVQAYLEAVELLPPEERLARGLPVLVN